ncbi:head decoration protein [Scandinavium manionii]|uniref:head decoration protein n=1 Tax=Scandinavium manionii TaxID=2926520 RepID=UPI001356932D|nr:head decoration protein [Scandinavium manionii]MCS2168047.1 head decoration protein [Scandinavium manionii]
MTLETIEFDQPNGGSDPAHTAILASGLTEAASRMTPVALDIVGEGNTGAAVLWKGLAGGAVGLLALDADGTEDKITVWKSGTWRKEDINWPDGVSDIQKQNAFAGTALSVI